MRAYLIRVSAIQIRLNRGITMGNDMHFIFFAQNVIRYAVWRANNDFIHILKKQVTEKLTCCGIDRGGCNILTRQAKTLRARSCKFIKG